jgi:hypothetical protein
MTDEQLMAAPTIQMDRPTTTTTSPTMTKLNESMDALTSRMPPPLRKLWESPAAFAAVFFAGFLFSFGIGAVVLWGDADVESLLASGQADQALAILDAKKQLTPQEMLWKGHALYQKGNREGMLKAYQGAVVAKATDERALQNTLDALGTDKVASLAVKTLEDWVAPELDERILALTADGNTRRRHSALECLNVRPSASMNYRLMGAVQVAVTDLGSDICEQKQAGLVAVAAFVEKKEAAPVLKAVGAWKSLYDQDSDVVFSRHRCLDAGLVKRTLASLSVIER